MHINIFLRVGGDFFLTCPRKFKITMLCLIFNQFVNTFPSPYALVHYVSMFAVGFNSNLIHEFQLNGILRGFFSVNGIRR